MKACKVLFLLSLALVSHAEMSHEEPNKMQGVESLSPEIRLLLNQEMIAIQKGMMAIVPAYASGNMEEVASIAKEIKNSYILAQNLTQEQRHELHNKLPTSFIQLDEKFHYYAGMLEHVAKNRKNELISFYFAKLSESCAGCHSLHAKHRFPGFEKTTETKAHSH